MRFPCSILPCGRPLDALAGQRSGHPRAARACAATSSPGIVSTAPATMASSRRTDSCRHNCSISLSDKSSRLSSRSWASFARAVWSSRRAARQSSSTVVASQIDGAVDSTAATPKPRKMTMSALVPTCLAIGRRSMPTVHSPPSGVLFDPLGAGSSARKWCPSVDNSRTFATN